MGSSRPALALLAVVVVILVALASCRRAAPPPALQPGNVLGLGGTAGFDRALEPRAFRFPRDHGAHARFRTEWWYLTGHLWSGEREFGYQVSLFRFGLAPGAPVAGEGWGAGHLYMGHFALTDVDGGRFHAAERFSRGAAGMAGAADDALDVQVEDFSLRLRDGLLWVRAGDRGHALDLQLKTGGDPVLNGERGLSRKSAGSASYYYSMPHWTAEGTVRTPSGRFPVVGSGWLDREWSSGALADDQRGWDWFALNFDDRSQLMLYRLRALDGGTHPYSGGTFIDPSGKPRLLRAGDVEYRIRRHWRSAATGARYPLAWRIELPALDLRLDVAPLVDAQELDLSVRYWEGAVELTASRAGRSLTGRGYVELTGYD